MKIVEQSYEIETPLDHIAGMLKRIEKAGRTCYKSEEKITTDSSEEFVKMIIRRGHESVLEHESITVRIICDRGVSHEIVRHRLAAYSQESTRYCNYGGKDIQIVHPKGLTEAQIMQRTDLYWHVQAVYDSEIMNGVSPQIARGVLPTSLKTEIVVTYDLREWRHFFKLRCAAAAHPQMREIAIPIHAEFAKLLPPVFGAAANV